jgi:hypothetical protein
MVGATRTEPVWGLAVHGILRHRVVLAVGTSMTALAHLLHLLDSLSYDALPLA